MLLEYLLSKGVPLENIGGGFKKDESGKIISAGKYTPFGHTDYQQIVAEMTKLAEPPAAPPARNMPWVLALVVT